MVHEWLSIAVRKPRQSIDKLYITTATVLCLLEIVRLATTHGSRRSALSKPLSSAALSWCILISIETKHATQTRYALIQKASGLRCAWLCILTWSTTACSSSHRHLTSSKIRVILSVAVLFVVVVLIRLVCVWIISSCIAPIEGSLPGAGMALQEAAVGPKPREPVLNQCLRRCPGIWR